MSLERLIKLCIGMVQKGKYFQLLLVVLLLIVLFGANNFFVANNSVNNSIKSDVLTVENSFKAKVVNVVDGDTFDYEKDGQKVRVRLMGVDTPETKDPRKPVQCFGQIASDKTKELIEGKIVSFQKDSKESKEKYGRELLYVYLEDGTMLNRWLITEGYAFATPQYQFDRREDFVNQEKQARMLSKGLWNEAVCKYKNQYGTN